MKVAIIGSRSIFSTIPVSEAIEKSGFEITEVISGGARGVDRTAHQWALMHSIPVRVFEPDWDTYGKAAGMIRNQLIVDEAEALIAVWDGASRGTQDSILKAKHKGIPVYIHYYNR